MSSYGIDWQPEDEYVFVWRNAEGVMQNVHRASNYGSAPEGARMERWWVACVDDLKSADFDAAVEQLGLEARVKRLTYRSMRWTTFVAEDIDTVMALKLALA